MDSFFSPALSLSTPAFLRAAYGVLLLASLVLVLPHARRFFLSERYGGYARSGRATDAIQNPVVLPGVMALWLVAAALLILGQHTVLAAFVNLLFCRYFFVFMRWRGVLRGMGAPGFMAYWLAACVFFLEYGLYLEPTGTRRSLALLLFQLDLAVIMFTAGLYKVLSGYSKNTGMQLGMVNPMWGHWWRFYQRLPPGHWIFRALNHLAYFSELLFAILVLIPPTRWIGGLILLVTFFFVTTQIRLWMLAEMVMLATFIYYPPGSPIDDLVVAGFGTTAAPAAGASAPPLLNAAIALAMILYIGLLPLAFGGLWFNFLKKQSLPVPFQRILETYTNAFGMILWRVFSADLVSFLINIYVERRDEPESVLWSRWGGWDWPRGLRYGHVGEAICVCSLFTTLKYYPSNTALFRERLLRYARTIPLPPGATLRFEYLSIKETEPGYVADPVAEYHVDPAQGTVEEQVWDRQAPIRRPHLHSPIFEAERPGSYAPVARAEAAPVRREPE